MDVKKCTVCSIKIDENIYQKDRNICKNCYNLIGKKYFNNTFSRNDNSKKKGKIVNSVNNNNRTLIIEISSSGKTFLMNHILHQKQEPIFLISKSLNQHPNIKTQTSDEIQPLENYENSTVVFDYMLLSKQESNIDLFFTRGRHSNIDILHISKLFSSPKKILLVIILMKLFS